MNADELAALIAQDPILACAETYLLAATPTPEWAQANVVWAAVERLFEIDPVRALAATDGVAVGAGVEK